MKPNRDTIQVSPVITETEPLTTTSAQLENKLSGNRAYFTQRRRHRIRCRDLTNRHTNTHIDVLVCPNASKRYVDYKFRLLASAVRQ